MAVVRFDHVDVVFGGQTAAALALVDQGLTREEILDQTGAVLGVHDATIAIEEGEICVLMGLSGSGKSSLLRCANGLNQVARGRVLVRHRDREIDIAAADEATLRDLRMNRVSMVFQQFALMPWRTIRENVGLGLELRGLAKGDRDRMVDEKLALVRLDQWADKHPHELSGGMQQRVGLARALATDADILLMDEPFSALDPLIREHLQDELLELQRNLKKTIIFVSHDLDEALKIGTHIAIMEGGRISQYGTPEEIVTQPANDYVRAFVANVNPLNVLKAAALMKPLNGDGGGIATTNTVTPETSMRAVIDAYRDTGGPLAVVDSTGIPVGLIGEQEIIAALARRGD
ncbi:MAG: choline ABC transporter ATP-binding protein [Alphaproteobacteria bacterium]|nr:choline ABC transporter ATP-binding protein [Alphaproteobacteria bacterium]